MSQKTPQTTPSVELFNGEPKICVRFGKDEVYKFATKKHGKFELSTKEELRNFMKRNGYKYYIINTKTGPQSVVSE